MTNRVEYHGDFVLVGYGQEMTLREYGYQTTRDRLMTALKEEGRLEILESIEGDVFMAGWFSGETADEIMWAACRGVAPGTPVPDDALVREVSARNFLVFEHGPNDNPETAWTEDYYSAVAMGAKLNYNREVWLEYYPPNSSGKYEIWMGLID
jgi:predicted transcriptional regulator YdeE